MTYVAQNSIEKKKVGLNELAEFVQLSNHYLGKILQDLVRKGLLNSSKGPGGGFWLDKSKSEMTIYFLLCEVEGEQVLHSCIMGKLKCGTEFHCPMHSEFTKCKSILFEQMKKTTLKSWSENSFDFK